MKKRTKITLCVGLFLFLCIATVGSYTVGKFIAGKKAADVHKKIAKVSDENKDFIGDKRIGEEITVMLVGNDKRDGEKEGRSDSLMVGYYNMKTKQPKLISIMRDSYVQIPGHGLDKINAAYAYGGASLTKKVLNNSFKLPVNYYVSLKFDDFVHIIDDCYPKGIKINAEKELDLDGVHIMPGKQIMHGNTLLQYARFRKDEEGDFGRIRRQQQVMTALTKQSKDLVSLVNLPKVLGEALGIIDTNLSSDVLVDVAKDFLLGKVKTTKCLSVPVKGSWNFNDNTPSGSVIEIDEGKNVTAISDFLKKKDDTK